jgi:hypothetical protein
MNTGGPAFPEIEIDIGVGGIPFLWHHKGLTIRDYFAAKAMQGDWAAGNAEDDLHVAAARYYYMADAMLSQREKS